MGVIAVLSELNFSKISLKPTKSSYAILPSAEKLLEISRNFV